MGCGQRQRRSREFPRLSDIPKHHVSYASLAFTAITHLANTEKESCHVTPDIPASVRRDGAVPTAKVGRALAIVTFSSLVADVNIVNSSKTTVTVLSMFFKHPYIPHLVIIR
jgi:hypothetical protein